MKKGVLPMTLGVTLLVLQTLSIIGNLKYSALPIFFVNITSFNSFVYELCYFFGFYWAVLIGIPLIIIGILRNNEKWDTNDILKIEASAAAEGLTIRQYIHKDLPEGCEETCEFYRGNPKKLNKYLADLAAKDKISLDAYYYLLQEYN